MSEDRVDELAVRRFNRETSCAKCNPLDVLEAAKQYILEQQKQGEPIDHVIVFTGRTVIGEGDGTRYFQGGTYGAHAQLGLCHAGTEMLWAD